MFSIRRFAVFAAMALAVTISQAHADTVAVGTNPQGSLTYAMGTAISKVMSEKTDKLYRVAPYGGLSTILPLLDRGELQLILLNSGFATFAYEGEGEYKGNPYSDIRMLGSIKPVINGWLVHRDSDINSVKDLAGKRVTAVFSSQRMFHYIGGASLAASGLDWGDVRRVPVPNYTRGIDMLTSGRVDAAYATVGVAAVKKAMASVRGGVRFIPINCSGDVKKRLQSVMPTATPVVLDTAKDDGIYGSTCLLKLNLVAVTSTHMSADDVYELTKTLHDDKSELAASLGVFKHFSPDAMVVDSKIPYHEGAKRYYKEIGLWKQKQ